MFSLYFSSGNGIGQFSDSSQCRFFSPSCLEDKQLLSTNMTCLTMFPHLVLSSMLLGTNPDLVRTLFLLFFKKRILGDSLADQWLGLSAFTATAWVQSLVRELRSHKWHSQKKEGGDFSFALWECPSLEETHFFPETCTHRPLFLKSAIISILSAFLPKP